MSEVVVHIEPNGSRSALFASNAEPGKKVTFVSTAIVNSTVKFTGTDPLEPPGPIDVPGNGVPVERTVAAVPAGRYPFILKAPDSTSELVLQVGPSGPPKVGFRVDLESRVIFQIFFEKASVPLVVNLRNDVTSAQGVFLKPVPGSPFEVLLAANAGALPFGLPIDQEGLALLLELRPSGGLDEAMLRQSGGTVQAEIIVDPDG